MQKKLIWVNTVLLCNTNVNTQLFFLLITVAVRQRQLHCCCKPDYLKIQDRQSL